MNITTSGDGENRDKISQSEVYVALITDSLLSNEKCLGEMKDAQALGMEMYAVIMRGIVIPKEVEEMPWKLKFHFGNNYELQIIAKQLRELIE